MAFGSEEGKCVETSRKAHVYGTCYYTPPQDGMHDILSWEVCNPSKKLNTQTIMMLRSSMTEERRKLRQIHYQRGGRRDTSNVVSTHHTPCVVAAIGRPNNNRVVPFLISAALVKLHGVVDETL